MFRHVVLMTWTEEATDEQVDAVAEGLRALPGRIPVIRAYAFGRDAGVSPGNADLAVVADFDDQQGYREYAGHPDHLDLIAERIRPILASRVAVQFDA